jgi:hypothetical protein
VRPAALSNPSRRGSRSNESLVKPLPPTRFSNADLAIPGRNTRLSNKINPTESINELIWTALTFSRPFGTCAEFFRSLFSRAVKSIAVAAEVRFFPSEIAGEIEKQCTSGAKALKNAGQGGTAEAVPFRGCPLSATCLARPVFITRLKWLRKIQICEG